MVFAAGCDIGKLAPYSLDAGDVVTGQPSPEAVMLALGVQRAEH